MSVGQSRHWRHATGTRKGLLHAICKEQAEEVDEQTGWKEQRDSVSDHGNPANTSPIPGKASYIQIRNDRKVKSVMGCELKRQLSEPGVGCAGSIMRKSEGGRRWSKGGNDHLKTDAWSGWVGNEQARVSVSCEVGDGCASRGARSTLADQLIRG